MSARATGLLSCMAVLCIAGCGRVRFDARFIDASAADSASDGLRPDTLDGGVTPDMGLALDGRDSSDASDAPDEPSPMDMGLADTSTLEDAPPETSGDSDALDTETDGETDSGLDSAIESDAGPLDTGRADTGTRPTGLGIIGGSGTIDLRGGAVGADGRVYAFGMFTGAIDFGLGEVPSVGGEDAFVAVYEPTGQLIWSRVIGSPGDDKFEAAAFDSTGRFVAGGRLGGNYDFGFGTRIVRGTIDMLIVAFDATGAIAWANVFGGPTTATYGGDFIREIEPIPTGFAIAGAVTGNVTFDMVMSNRPGTTSDATLVFVDETGAYQSVRRYGTSVINVFYSVDRSTSGELFVCGFYEGTPMFESFTPTATGVQKAIVLKYDSGLAGAWAQSFGISGQTWAEEIVAAPDGGAYVYGIFNGTIDIGAGPVTTRGAMDAFLVRLSNTGAILWGRRLGSTGDERANLVQIDDLGRVVISGRISGAVDFGTGLITPMGTSAGFIARYLTDGTLDDLTIYDGTGADTIRAISRGPSGTFVFGVFDGTNSFGGHMETANGGDDAFFWPIP